MKSQFDWHTDEEAWEELPPDPPAESDRRWPWRTVLLLTALLLAGGFSLYRQAVSRVDEATAKVTADVVSSYNILQKAVAADDAELFVTVLSGRDPQWTATQESLFAEDLLLDRQPLGLYAQPVPVLDVATLADTAVSLDFNPDLTSAVLSVPQSYTYTLSSGNVESVVLMQTIVYRKGSRNWLYAPPEREFWGEWQSINEENLVLSAPTRDMELARRLSQDLDEAVAAVCAEEYDLGCDPDLKIQMRLGNDPDLLLALRNSRPLLDQSGPGQLELPAPTLLGLPLDEGSYQVVRDVYTRALLKYTITHVVDWVCCQRATMYQVLLDYQMAQMGYGRWPVTAHDYLRMLLEGYDTRQLLSAWARNNEFGYVYGMDGWLPYTAVDFLHHQYPDLSTPEMMRRLVAQPTLAEWITSMATNDTTADSRNGAIARLEADWLDYAHAQAATISLPQPLPDKDVLALCSEEGLPGNVTLYRYRWDSGEWQPELETPLAFMNPLPAGDGLIVQQLNFNNELNQNQALLWRDNALAPISLAPLSISFGQTDPSGRYLLVYTGSAPGVEPVPELYDLSGCSSERCASRRIDGLPTWSPTGKQAVLALGQDLDSTVLFQTQGRIFAFNPEVSSPSWDLVLTNRWLMPLSRQTLGYGYAPFWLGSDRVGYLRDGETAVQELVVTDLPQGEAEVVLTLDDLRGYLEPSARNDNLFMRFALASSANPNLIFITAIDRRGRDAYVFSYDLRLEKLQLRLTIGYDYDHSFELSPNGRFLMVTGTRILPQSSFLRGTTLIHNIATGETTELLTAEPTFLPTPAHDWSEDGRWLITNIDERIFGLLAPEFNYQQVLRHDLGQCSAVLWSD